MFQHRMHRHGHGAGPRGFGHGRGFGPGHGFGPGRHFGHGTFNPNDPEIRALVGDVRGLGQYLFRQGASGGLNDTEKVKQLREIVGRTRAEIEALFGPDDVTSV